MNSAKSKGSSDVNMGIGVNLYANKKILAGENVNNAVDIYETYINERKSSDKFRIILNIHPYCSNVLFNPITEIVKDEGSNDAICLNFTEMTSDSFNGKVIGKKDNFLWSAYDAIRDKAVGTGQPNLNIELISKFIIPLPPVNEQNAIVERIDKVVPSIESLIAVKQQKIEELKEYKKSIIYEYVTGKKNIL